MESYAFLVAQRDYLKKFKLLSFPIEKEDDSKKGITTISMSVVFGDESHLISRSSRTIPDFWANAVKIESARQTILYNHKNNEISFLEAVGNMVLEEFSNSLVKSASIKNYLVTYWVGLNRYIVPLQPNKSHLIQDYENLVASRALLKGYTIKEIKGSHFEVTSASGRVQATSLNNCTCREFTDFNDCLHNKFARAVARNRPHLSYLLR
jgi:hypothetical protein